VEANVMGVEEASAESKSGENLTATSDSWIKKNCKCIQMILIPLGKAEVFLSRELNF
jgi:hypothetical protein